MCKKLICLMSFVLLLGLSSSVFAATYPGQLGINASHRGGLYVDVVKEQYRWYDLSTGEQLNSSQVDAQGWPECDAKYVRDRRPVAEWSGGASIDDPEVYRIDMSGTYKCSFTGQATLTRLGGDFTFQNQVYDEPSNTTTYEIVVDLPGLHHSLISMTFTDTRRTPTSDLNTGITNLKMIRPGYPAETTQVFTDAFMDCLTGASFSTIRLMDLTGTNGAEPTYPDTTEWSQRKLTTDASQVRMEAIGKLQGGAWEYAIDVVNAANMDAWINIQCSASTDYVTQLATLFKNNLNAGLNIYLENSNEVWNTASAFLPQYNYNVDQAAALGLTKEENYARRTVELGQIFESVFGAGSLNTRIRPMLCWQAYNYSAVNNMLQYINDNHGTPNTLIYGIASGTYFSGGANEGESVEKILSDCHADIDNKVAQRQGWLNVANNNWSLTGGYCTYEGGPGHGGGSTTNMSNRVKAERDPGMATELKYNIADNFFDLGGNLAMHFSLSTAYNRYGMWGLTDDVASPDRNYKYQAVRDLLGDSDTSAPGPPVRLTATVLNDTELVLDWRDNTESDLASASYDLYRDTTSGGPYTQIATGLTTSFYTDTGLTTGTTYYYVATATDTSSNESVNSHEASAAPQTISLPSPWQRQDVGSPAVPGSASYASGTFTVVSDGHDISGTSDAFHYVYQPISGDGEIIARVVSLDNVTTKWAKTGVMFRETLTGPSTYAFVNYTTIPSREYNNWTLLHRDTTGGASTQTVWEGSASPPYWVKLVREGNSFSGYVAEDGDTWQLIDERNIPMATNIYVGLAVTSHSSVDLSTATFDNVTVTGAAQPPGQATNPSPADGATDVDINADLSWTAGSGATSHDVHFGTSSPPPFIQNQTQTTYDPGTMAENTTYYWRIDEKNDYGTTTGVVWSFTAGAGCTPSTMHVDSIVVTVVNVGKGNKAGLAEVWIVDNCSGAVSGADVTGTFSGDINETVSGATDSNGYVALQTTGTARGGVNVTFCVDNVTHATLTYNEADNVETCDSN